VTFAMRPERCVCRSPTAPASTAVEEMLDRVRNAGVSIKDLSIEEPDLEDVFVQLTSLSATEREMKYVNLGKSGLKVSRICLGTMAYADGFKGQPSVGARRGRRRNRSTSAPSRPGSISSTRLTSIPLGTSEEILGRAIKKYAKRDEIVIATKVHGEMRAERPQRQRTYRASTSSARLMRA
jgi:poly-gamma-glutamate capsule biosynthesis protein CapA/YwtB (metallophosphatase superfamily)